MPLTGAATDEQGRTAVQGVRQLLRIVLGLVIVVGATCRGVQSAWAQVPHLGGAADPPAALLLDHEFADPSLLQVGDTYFLYATGTASTNVQVGRTDDFVEWTQLADALPTLPGWAEPGFTWAPAVAAMGGGSEYVLYFVARDRASGDQCIGVATSHLPEGPFSSTTAQPLVCQVDLGGSIDPYVFIDDEQPFLLWKNDAPSYGAEPWLWIQPLSQDGVALVGAPTALLHPDRVWEGGVVEAPALVRRHDTYYLFYSANDYASAQYAIGYARAPTLLGPYRKTPGPLLASQQIAGVIGPGGQDILERGEMTWLVYHSWDPTMTYRYLRLDRLVWNGDTPVLSKAASS